MSAPQPRTPPSPLSGHDEDARAPSERRRVSALLVDLAGFADIVERVDPDAVTEALNALLRRVQTIAARYEGHVDPGHGDAALVLFGAPSTHEDDPERATRAALEILERPLAPPAGLDTPLRPRAAVATGVAVVGWVGVGESARYAALGDVVRVVRGLLGEAGPDELLIDEPTAIGLGGRARLEPRPVGALAASRVLDWLAADDQDPHAIGHGPLIGREIERTALTEALTRLVDGRAGVIAVTGPAGAGKSRLVREALRWEGPWTVHVGRCISYGRTMPLHLWSEIAQSLLALPGAADALDTLDRNDRSGGRRREAAEWLAAGLRDQLSTESSARPRSRAFEGISDLLVHAAHSQPRVLVLEDLHWADTASMDLLSALISRVRALPILIIALWRAEASDQDDQRLLLAAKRANLPFRRLALEPLPPVQTRQLIDGMLGSRHDLPEAALERLVQLSGGVPLFVDELLRQLREQGALVHEPQRWRYAPEADRDELSVSPGAFAVLAVRVERLGAELRAALELAAVLGAEFDPDVVDLALGERPDRWEALEAAGLVLGGEDLASGRQRLRFRQPLLREVIYGGLLPGRRQHLHQLVVESEGGALRPVERAWHLERAGRGAEAARCWAEAARQARGLDVIQESIDLFERASRADATEELIVAPELAGMLLRAGRLADAIALTDRLLPRLVGTDLHAVHARLLCERAYLAYRMGDGPGIVRHAEAARVEAEKTDDPLALADALRNVGIGHEFTGRYALARAAWQRVVELATGPNEVPLRRVVVNVYNSLGEICRMEGRYAEALEYYDQSRDAKQRLNPGPYNLVWLINTSAALVGCRRYDEALTRSAEALRLVEASGARGVLPEVLVNHALALEGVKRGAEAREAAKRARDEAERQGQGEILGLALRVYGLLQLAHGDPAVGALSESVARLSGAGKPVDEARSRRALAEALERGGDVAGSVRERERAAKLLQGVGLDAQAEAMFRKPRRLMDLAMAPSAEPEKSRRAAAMPDLF